MVPKFYCNVSSILLLILLIFFIAENASSQTFTKSSYSFSISEESPIGNTLGEVTASHEDPEGITYTISGGNTNIAFKINPSTGVITTTKRLNYHTQSKHTLKIKAAIPKGTSDETTVTVTISPAPSILKFSILTWSTAAVHPEGSHENQGRVVAGKLYVFGGFDPVKQKQNIWTPTKRSYVYDPVSDKFSAIADLPHTPNGSDYGGVTHSGITTDGTDIYFAGGYTANSSGQGQIFGTKQAWKYNVATNTYTSLPDLPIAIAAGQMEYLNGKLHHISGTNQARNKDLGDHFVLDLDNLQDGWKSLALLPNPRQHAGSAVFEGKIYFIGGQTGHDDHLVARNEVHVYDPSKNEWGKVKDLPVPEGATGRGHITSAVVVFGDRIIVLGGETAHGKKTNLVSAYAPSENKWTALTPLPQNIMAGVASVLNNNLFYLGGVFSKTNRKAVPIFPANPTPTITIINPVNKDDFKEGTILTIEADAAISEGSISKVEFFVGNTKLGEDTGAPFSYTWNSPPGGTYLLSAKATSDKGVSTTSSSIEITISANSPPSVQIIVPEDGKTYIDGEIIKIEAEADDDDGVIEVVEFFAGTNKLGEVNIRPYEFTWTDVPMGMHSITVKATDNEGSTTTSAPIQVSVMKAGNIFPVVTIVSPQSNTAILEGGNLEIIADASDADGSILKVEFYYGDIKLGESTTTPYSYTWTNIPSGNHEIFAKAFDIEGASTLSFPVSVSISNIVTCPNAGSLSREYWLGLSGASITSFNFKNPPSGSSEVLNFEAPEEFGNNYATRLRGYICPPADGLYTFWISSSHNSELWLSPDEKLENMNKIAYSHGNHIDGWEHNSIQNSSPVQLKAGRFYYIEAIHLTEDGADHMAVGWKWPNEKLERPIQGRSLLKYMEGTVTNTNDTEFKEHFTVYPVPTSNKVFIEFLSDFNDQITVEIMNVQGAIIGRVFNGKSYKGQVQKFEIETSNLSSGVYFVRLTTQKSNKVKRIIIN